MVELAERYWLEHAQHLGWSETVKGHLDALEHAIGEDTRADAVDASMLAQAIALWRNDVGPSTINRRISVAQGLWNRARDVWGLQLPHIPWRRLRLEEPDNVPPYIALHEREAIFASARRTFGMPLRLLLAPACAARAC